MKILKYIIVTLLVVFAVIGDVKTALGEGVINTDNKIAFSTSDKPVWTPTFQLCWNEFINLVGTPSIQYIYGNPKLADELNKQLFTKDDLSEDDYYISVSKMTLKHKKEIEAAIHKKFNEKSDILNQFTFDNVPDNKTNKWFIYSMLIKNFEFITPFKILNADYFNNTETTKYKYFGFIPRQTDYKAKSALENGYIEPLFYANDDDFALSILNKDKNEEMIIYLTNSDKSFDDIYNEINNKCKNKFDYLETRINSIYKKHGKDINIEYNNYYKIPFIKIDEIFSFDKELANKPIAGLDKHIWFILKTLQTVKFDLNNEGAKLKSEAGIAILNATSAMPRQIVNLDSLYYFDRPFVIFLKEANKDKPYFAAKIYDAKYLVEN